LVKDAFVLGSIERAITFLNGLSRAFRTIKGVADRTVSNVLALHWERRRGPGRAAERDHRQRHRQVMIVDKGKGRFELRPVRLGRRGTGYVEIRDGVKDGERVVTTANFLIDAENAELNEQRVLSLALFGGHFRVYSTHGTRVDGRLSGECQSRKWRPHAPKQRRSFGSASAVARDREYGHVIECPCLRVVRGRTPQNAHPSSIRCHDRHNN
jgi:hypothetical protein